MSGNVRELKMPRVGVAMTEGTIVRWLKNVGDRVEQNEILLEIATEKIEFEVPSPCNGTVVELLAKENDVVQVLETIARIEEG